MSTKAGLPIFKPAARFACLALLIAANVHAQAPSINPGGVVNAASFSAGGAVAPGSIIAIFGNNLASGTGNATMTPLPANLAGTSVKVNGLPAPLYYVSPTQINAQLPYETQTGTASVVVTAGSSSSAAVTVNVAPAAPGIFPEGSDRSATVNTNGYLNATNNPAASGSVVVTYLTGQGTLDNPVPTGVAASASPLSRATAAATATIGGQNAPIAFLGLTPTTVGLSQANIQVPNLPYGDYPLTLTIGGQKSNSVMLTVSSTGVSFKHVVVIFQENRTPDNLFLGLCGPPYGSAQTCSNTATSGKYDIQTQHWKDSTAPNGVTEPGTVPLTAHYDLSHAHNAFMTQCNPDPTTKVCRMDGAKKIACINQCNSATTAFKYVDNSTGVLNPYLDLATQYGWANLMFQTNQGPSYPAHQYIFSGTSAVSASDDAAGVFMAENPANNRAGCAAPAGATVSLIDATGAENRSVYPCGDHLTMPDVLPGQVTWRYYAPNGTGPLDSIWMAPNSIQHICQSTGPGGQCAGKPYANNVDPNPADVLTDISNCKLNAVNWVIPTGQNSDHTNVSDDGGPSWVASIVNAIGKSTSCDNGAGYWNDTAIFITWDDWGGWYDHEPPPFLPGVQGAYQLGFRVPLVVVSAYTQKGYISNTRYDFGSILRFIEHNFYVQEGALNFADARASTDMTEFFNLAQTPRAFQSIAAPKSAAFFLNDKRRAADPDDDQ